MKILTRLACWLNKILEHEKGHCALVLAMFFLGCTLGLLNHHQEVAKWHRQKGVVVQAGSQPLSTAPDHTESKVGYQAEPDSDLKIVRADLPWNWRNGHHLSIWVHGDRGSIDDPHSLLSRQGADYVLPGILAGVAAAVVVLFGGLALSVFADKLLAKYASPVFASSL